MSASSLLRSHANGNGRGQTILNVIVGWTGLYKLLFQNWCIPTFEVPHLHVIVPMFKDGGNTFLFATLLTVRTMIFYAKGETFFLNVVLDVVYNHLLSYGHFRSKFPESPFGMEGCDSFEVFDSFVRTESVYVKDVDVTITVYANYHNSSPVRFLVQTECEVDGSIDVEPLLFEEPVSSLSPQVADVVVLELVPADAVRGGVVRVVVVLAVELNFVFVLGLNTSQNIPIETKSFTITRTNSTRPEEYAICFYRILFDVPDRKLVYNLILLVEHVIELLFP